LHFQNFKMKNETFCGESAENHMLGKRQMAQHPLTQNFNDQMSKRRENYEEYFIIERTCTRALRVVCDVALLIEAFD
jgi:hypothetical protein